MFEPKHFRRSLDVVVVAVSEGQNIHLLALGPANIVLELLREGEAFVRRVIRVVRIGIVENKLQTVGQLDETGVCVSEGVKNNFAHNVLSVKSWQR
ncbi:MAG: hypothetical protein ABSE16_10805 [Verrucomicrobiota bacterium]